MQFGAVFPQTEIGSDPAAVKAYAQAAEGLGYDYLLAYDHVLGANPDRPDGWRGPYTHNDLFHEPMVLFGYLAALTERIELTTGVIVLPQRQTALVAKQAAQIAVLSGGRLRLGVGIGWNSVEFEALGENFNNRGKRIEEQVTLLRQLWSQPLVKFSGQYHHISDAGLNPLPLRPIPVWFGGTADVVLERMARLGDGWIANSMSPEKFQIARDKLHTYLSQAGRSPDSFGLDMRLNLKNSPREQWAADIARWRALGVTHLSLNTMGVELKTVDAHIAVLRQFKEETA